MQAVSSVKRRVSTLPAETQLIAAVIKRHIMFETTSIIISETVWSPNAFSLACLPQRQYLLYLAFLHIFSPALALSVSDAC